MSDKKVLLSDFLKKHHDCKEIRVEYKWWSHDLTEEENQNRESDEEYSFWGTAEEIIEHYTDETLYPGLGVLEGYVEVIEESKDLCIVYCWEFEN